MLLAITPVLIGMQVATWIGYQIDEFQLIAHGVNPNYRADYRVDPFTVRISALKPALIDSARRDQRAEDERLGSLDQGSSGFPGANGIANVQISPIAARPPVPNLGLGGVESPRIAGSAPSGDPRVVIPGSYGTVGAPRTAEPQATEVVTTGPTQPGAIGQSPATDASPATSASATAGPAVAGIGAASTPTSGDSGQPAPTSGGSTPTPAGSGRSEATPPAQTAGGATPTTDPFVGERTPAATVSSGTPAPGTTPGVGAPVTTPQVVGIGTPGATTGSPTPAGVPPTTTPAAGQTTATPLATPFGPHESPTPSPDLASPTPVPSGTPAVANRGSECAAHGNSTDFHVGDAAREWNARWDGDDGRAGADHDAGCVDHPGGERNAGCDGDPAASALDWTVRAATFRDGDANGHGDADRGADTGADGARDERRDARRHEHQLEQCESGTDLHVPGHGGEHGDDAISVRPGDGEDTAGRAVAPLGGYRSHST
ncbi:MAG: hypothetical protein HY329_21945 [Chloroflexi bacterium]|nr:hypothetical protein [Chloroflexota bacterium]